MNNLKLYEKLNNKLNEIEKKNKDLNDKLNETNEYLKILIYITNLKDNGEFKNKQLFAQNDQKQMKKYISKCWNWNSNLNNQ